ncbi:thiamine pyrophosphate-binding protein [Salinisphaera orenii]|uniref:Acetolactate synthase n=1 Tax=Salinisphaera orenii YIM 95161 TaxID=1051139 RepID=A0A423Q331_9GAMM|nr:thiamine pyrophosphate-binding protein [Salinisphaera halophila]ROO33029.1 acetolactate synthase [Salinisphaera halophila YIM 95161]
MSEALTAATLIAKSLKARGTTRVYALCGGHIMPIWMALVNAGIEIIDVRDERSAVYMAHASAAVSGGLGVALVTAGPGVTNAMTGIANAHKSRIPVLILSGLPPRTQENRGALQDMSHIDLVRSITRYAHTIGHAHAVARELDAAIAAALGHGDEPGPAFIDLPVDIQRETVPAALCATEHVAGVARPKTRPGDDDLAAAVKLIAQAQRPVVISGRGANTAPRELAAFLTAARAGYLDTGETKGIVPESHAAHIGAVRGAAMQQADLIITVGRRLDFQLAYGSPAVFGQASLLRIADTAAELSDNRLGDVSLLGDLGLTLAELARRLDAQPHPSDEAWLAGLRGKHAERVAGLLETLESAPSDAAGRMAPNRLLAELKKRLDPQAVIIADGGDSLSFARVALNGRTYLDPGPLGCIGIGPAFAIGAAKAAPGRQVVAVTGDGSFGFTAMELDTAVRHKAACMIVVSNNGSWAIEVRDQMDRFGRAVGTQLQYADYAAMARAFGMKAWRLETAAEIAPALDEAFAALADGEPVLIDAVTSPEPPSSDSKSGLAWVPDHQALEAWDAAERNWLGLS